MLLSEFCQVIDDLIIMECLYEDIFDEINSTFSAKEANIIKFISLYRLYVEFQLDVKRDVKNRPATKDLLFIDRMYDAGSSEMKEIFRKLTIRFNEPEFKSRLIQITREVSNAYFANKEKIEDLGLKNRHPAYGMLRSLFNYFNNELRPSWATTLRKNLRNHFYADLEA